MPKENTGRKVHGGIDFLRERLGTGMEVGTSTCLQGRSLPGAFLPTLHTPLYVARTLEFTGPNRDPSDVSLSLSILGSI